MGATNEKGVPLHPIERRILAALKELGKSSFKELSEVSGLDRGAISKAAQWLSQKGLCYIEEVHVDNYLALGQEGLRYAEVGLPERRLVEVLRKKGGMATLSEITESVGMTGLEVKVGVIWAKKNGWIDIVRSDGNSLIKLLSYPSEKTKEEELLSILRNGRALESQLEGYSNAVKRLSGRPNVLLREPIKEYYISLTEEGRALVRSISMESLVEEISQLTPELIASGRWKEVRLARYDLFSPVKPTYAARTSPLTELIELVKDVFVELGFEEIRGPLVEIAFWNFDALFQPQDHPAREMHDTFYLDSPRRGDLPEKIAKRVKAVHENGWTTGSRGWRYRWSDEEASLLLLRTHTTATTVRYLLERNEPPVKVFTIDRVYRNENVDWKHLAELHQIDGIMMDRGVTLRHLMGIIKEFYSMLGIPHVRFRPSYFPYTEPSAEVEVYLPWAKSWAELGGMGIFRPEVTRPLGVKYPVLAWGLGLERLAMTLYRIDDIRLLYSNDLTWIRSTSPISTLIKTRGHRACR